MGGGIARNGGVGEVGRSGRELDVGEEAVVEVGAVDYEVGEEVVGVPEEEVFEFAGDGFGEGVGGEELGCWHQTEGDSEGDESACVEREGFGGFDVCHD